MKNSVRAFLFMAIVVVTNVTFAQQSKGIYFQNDSFAKILAKAKSEGKNVFIDAYTSWCGPCKWMAKNVFPNDTVGEFYNSNFINVSIDVEKGEGIEIKKRFEINCYPTYLFIDGNGKLLHRASGSCFVQKFIKLGHEALMPEKQFKTFEDKYKSESITPQELIQYMSLRKASCLSTKEELEKYFSSQRKVEYVNRMNWSVIRDFSGSIDMKSLVFRYLIDNREKFYPLYTTDSINSVITSVYASAMDKCLYAEDLDTVEYKNLRAGFVALKLPFADRVVLGKDLSFYKRNKNWQQYAKTATTYVECYSFDKSGALNNIAYDFYENINDPKYLNLAINWVKCSIEIHTGSYNTDTYASLLYKLGKKEEAEIMELKAIELAKSEGEEGIISQMEELLQKIRLLKTSK